MAVLSQLTARILPTYDLIANRLPAGLAASLDTFVSSYRNPVGGPLNGQVHRQRIVRELVELLDPELVVETGTYRGSSTEFFAHVADCPIITVEAQERYFRFAHRRLRVYPQVTMTLSDSRTALRDLATRADLTSKRVLFYLDAHWHADLPLREELEIIERAFPEAAVLIDDFKVDDDPGYGYDDYGPGKVLSDEIIPSSIRATWMLLFPSLPASEESGARRGCRVLVSPTLRPRIEAASSLRP
jgi:hypothetical protein